MDLEIKPIGETQERMQRNFAAISDYLSVVTSRVSASAINHMHGVAVCLDREGKV
jgi:hypothetical protein